VVTTDISTLVSAAERYQSDLTAFLRDLVRIPTVNGRDPEAPLTIRIQGEARKLGLEAKLVTLQPERPNILATYGAGANRFALIAHMDTVAEGDPSGWSSPPFAAEVNDGCIIGRGAADNKAGIAWVLHTAVLQSSIIDPKQQAILAGVGRIGSSPEYVIRLIRAPRARCDLYVHE
jgi:acetylornithine deacetylase/succinyl-diaminopimelate desuccinylase-like protein